MNQIKCPHCGTVFTINETEYSQLLAQVRGHEFEKEIHERLSVKEPLRSSPKINCRPTSMKRTRKLLICRLNWKSSLSNQLDMERSLAEKEKEVQALQNQLEQARLQHQNELQRSLTSLEKERDSVKNQLALQEKEMNWPCLLFAVITRSNSRLPMNRWNFTRTSRPSSPPRPSEKVWKSMRKRSLTRSAPMPSPEPNLARTMKSPYLAPRATSSSATLMNLDWSSFPSCLK